MTVRISDFLLLARQIDERYRTIGRSKTKSYVHLTVTCQFQRLCGFNSLVRVGQLHANQMRWMLNSVTESMLLMRVKLFYLLQAYDSNWISYQVSGWTCAVRWNTSPSPRLLLSVNLNKQTILGWKQIIELSTFYVEKRYTGEKTQHVQTAIFDMLKYEIQSRSLDLVYAIWRFLASNTKPTGRLIIAVRLNLDLFYCGFKYTCWQD